MSETERNIKKTITGYDPATSNPDSELYHRLITPEERPRPKREALPPISD